MTTSNAEHLRGTKQSREEVKKHCRHAVFSGQIKVVPKSDLHRTYIGLGNFGFWFRISKNGSSREGLSVALTVQRYNREIALYEFLGNFFWGNENFFSAGVMVSRCHGVKVVFRECQRVHYIEIINDLYIVSRFREIRTEFDTLTL